MYFVIDSMLISGLAQAAEVVYQILEVASGVDIETLPEVAANDDTAEAQVANLRNILERNATLGHYTTAYDAATGGIAQLGLSKRGTVLGLGYAVEDVAQKEILAVLTVLGHLIDGVAGSRNRAVVALRQLCVATAQMNAHQIELLLQVEVVVHDDTAVVFLGNQRKEALAIDRFRIGLPKVQYVQPFLEKRGKNHVFLDKKFGARQ